jgi:hypothetical protein
MHIRSDGQPLNSYESLFEKKKVAGMLWETRLTFFKDLLADIDNFPDLYKIEGLLFYYTPLKQKNLTRTMVESKVNALIRSIKNKAIVEGATSETAELIARFAREKRINQPLSYEGGRTFLTEAIACKIPNLDKKRCPKLFREGYDVVKMVQLLINNGADVNKHRLFLNENDEIINDLTPLMMAAQIGNTNLVGILLIYGANAREKSQGRTALDIAKQHGAPKKIIEMLERAMR